MVNLAVTGSQIPKFGDVCACGTRATGPIAKWIAREDLAHCIGLVKAFQCPVEFVGMDHQWRIPVMKCSKFRKLVMFRHAAQQPLV